MSENFLSQKEIDALLGNGDSVEERPVQEREEIDDTKKDIIGEVGNISMSTAATTLSSLLNKQVLITTPKVTWMPFQKVIDECSVPKVAASIEFKSGLSGDNLLMMDVKDSAIIADLMIGGKGNIEEKETLTDMEMSAVAEAMNQMIGSASTSMATMLDKEIDILPPNVELWDNQENIEYKNISNEHYICKIAFSLKVEGLINSEIMQIFTKETVDDITSIMLGENESSVKEDSDVREEPNSSQSKENRLEGNNDEEKVAVKKPVFPNLNQTDDEAQKPRNLELIMDVPLEFSVQLGKTNKTINEILTFGNGSVVELEKLADEPLEIYVNGKLIAHGEVVVINENFGIRITNILSKEQRVKKLN